LLEAPEQAAQTPSRPLRRHLEMPQGE
jgi:hypothetical protein